MSHNPGRANFPRPSMTCADALMRAWTAGPTDEILLPEIVIVWSGSTLPLTTSMTETCVMAMSTRSSGGCERTHDATANPTIVLRKKPSVFIVSSGAHLFR